MDNLVLEVCLTVIMACILAFLAYIKRRMDSDKAEAIERAEGLRNDLGGALTNMVNALDFELPNMESIKEVIEDSIQGIMGTFHQPTGGDMIMGAISQLVMSKIQPQMPPAIGEIVGQMMPPPIQPPSEP